MYEPEKLKTDVLIVGGGISGSMAAIQAREHGADVLVLELANTYRSGSAGSGIDHLYSYVPPVHEKVGYTKDHMKEDMADQNYIRAGLGDREISDHFVDTSYERIIGLEKYGLKFRFEDSHLAEGFRLVPQFHSIPTSLNFEGRDLKVKLTNAMIQAGVRIVNHAQVVEILKNKNGDAIGAVALSTRAEKLFVAEAKAVVIATSNSAVRLSPPINQNDEHFENPSSSGSGYGITLPLDAGAEMANLEFMLKEGILAFFGFSTRVGSPGSSWWPAARVVDDDGNIIVRRIIDYDINEPEYLEKNIRQYAEFMDEFYSMSRYLAEGRQLYMDFEDATDAETEYIKWSLSHEGRHWLFIRNLEREHVDFKKVKIPYKYEKRTLMRDGICTGAFVNWKCETTVNGLYAAGDAMGASSESGSVAVVFGYEAGLQAAEYAKKAPAGSDSDIDNEQIQKIQTRIEQLRSNEGGEFWRNVEKALRGIVVAFGNLPLTDTKIENALYLVKKLKQNPNLSAKDTHEMARSFQVLSLIESAEAIFMAAKNRDSSFGPYKRVKRYADIKDHDGGGAPTQTVVYTLYKDKNGEYQYRTRNLLK